MGVLRSETFYAGKFLIEQMLYYGTMQRIKHDGGDIILFETPTREAVSIHIIDRSIPLYEVRNTMEDNNRKQIHTLFVLWCDMLLPYNGQRLAGADWQVALYSLYGDCIYGYDTFKNENNFNETFVFPVYFRGEGPMRTIEYGPMIRPQYLRCYSVSTNLPGFQDTWRVADFSGQSGTAHDPQRAAWQTETLIQCYALLGVEMGDDLDTIKRAYRLLARKYHPDTNRAADATAQMQSLNQAYAKITDAWETRGGGQ
jgi:hypothetical protein